MRQRLRRHVVAYRALFERSLCELRICALLRNEDDIIIAGELELLDRIEQRLRTVGPAHASLSIGELYALQRAVVAAAHVLSPYENNRKAPITAYTRGYAIAILCDIRRAYAVRLIEPSAELREALATLRTLMRRTRVPLVTGAVEQLPPRGVLQRGERVDDAALEALRRRL